MIPLDQTLGMGGEKSILLMTDAPAACTQSKQISRMGLETPKTTIHSRKSVKNQLKLKHALFASSKSLPAEWI